MINSRGRCAKIGERAEIITRIAAAPAGARNYRGVGVITFISLRTRVTHACLAACLYRRYHQMRVPVIAALVGAFNCVALAKYAPAWPMRRDYNDPRDAKA